MSGRRHGRRHRSHGGLRDRSCGRGGPRAEWPTSADRSVKRPSAGWRRRTRSSTRGLARRMLELRFRLSCRRMPTEPVHARTGLRRWEEDGGKPAKASSQQPTPTRYRGRVSALTGKGGGTTGIVRRSRWQAWGVYDELRKGIPRAVVLLSFPDDGDESWNAMEITGRATDQLSAVMPPGTKRPPWPRGSRRSSMLPKQRHISRSHGRTSTSS